VPKPSPILDPSIPPSESDRKQRDLAVSGASVESAPPKKRRRFAASEKLRLLKAAEAALASGERGALEALLRKEGIYSSHLTAWRRTRAIYGGFACGTWSYSGTKPKVAPADVGYAIEIAGVNDATVVEDVSFTAAAGTAAATSSVAAFVNASAKVTLRRVELVAGKGFAGSTPKKAADGALMTSMPTAATLNGNVGGATNGGLAQLCTCVGGETSEGGMGGKRERPRKQRRDRSGGSVADDCDGWRSIGGRL
jgi:hypothetical protein